MKNYKTLLLILTVIALIMSSIALSAKSAHPLAKATDVKKIQSLIRSTNYKAVTENDFVAVRKNLCTLAKAVDIKSDEGRMKAGILYMSIINFSQFSKNPAGTRVHVTQEWQDTKASDVAKSLKKSTQEEFAKMIDEKYPCDEAKAREEFRKAKKAK
jgi:hypothetical protein